MIRREKMKTILCRIGWMKKYDGSEELYRGRMKWDEDDCGEAWNFFPGDDSIIRGFIMLTAKDAEGHLTGTININKLGASVKDKYIQGVTIIFYAPRPPDDTNFVVGWYENAKVYRNWQHGGEKNEYRDNQRYSFKVNENKSFLIPESKRNIKIITAQYAKANKLKGSYPGQHSVFYNSSNVKYVDSIFNKIKKIPSNISFDTSEDLYDPAEEYLTQEGRKILKRHLIRERDVKLIRKFKKNLTSYRCVVCNFDFEQKYGEVGKQFVEAHHIKPVASLDGSKEIGVKNLVAVCSNCHRMLHRKTPQLDWRKLKKALI